MEHYDLGFVVLHYLAYDMTLDCVNSLLSLFSEKQIKIVIVDNCSSNNSGKKLLKYYENDLSVNVIINSSNEGFAKGNNVGYKFLKENGIFDFIVVLNNDIIINDKLFLDKIIKLKKQYDFFVLGPDIYNPILDVHQSPTRCGVGVTRTQVIKEREIYKKRLKYIFLYVCIDWIKKVAKKNLRFLRLKNSSNIIFSKDILNPVLHGACYIFSSDYINNRDYAFYPKTFLYFEEEILYYECVKDNMLMIYSPEISVNHYEDVSTNLAFRNKFKKEKIKTKRILESIEIFLELSIEN